MSDAISTIYLADTTQKAVFSNDGPAPQFLVNSPAFKALVAGLEPGQRIPLHPGEAAVYHFISGTGVMTVDDETYSIQPGVTIAVPSGAARGMNARTRLVFLGVQGG